MKSFNRNETKKEHREIIAHFKRIEKELEEQKEELQSINREIQTLGLSVGYSQHEEKIKNCLLALHQYLEHPDEQNRNIFTDEAAQLSQSLTAIVGGLLGKNVFNPDIMAVLREATGVSI
jgi:predicted nuclease with TOPRIM domain